MQVDGTAYVRNQTQHTVDERGRVVSREQKTVDA